METTERTPRGQATDRIVAALAKASPKMMTRQEFLDSPELAGEFHPDAAPLNQQEKIAAAKTLGRLIHNGIVGESLFLRPTPEFPIAGLIAISVDLRTLGNAWNDWEKGPRLPQDEPTQEWVVEQIIARSKLWVKQYEGTIPIVLRDVNIVHGSESFDILVFVRYSDPDQFLKYIRTVIQRTPHVARTHTMQIASTLERTLLRPQDNSNELPIDC